MNTLARYDMAMRKDGAEINNFVVGRDGVIIGRASDCDVVLADSMVSRHHARFWVEDRLLKVEDLGSRNGVLVNGERVTRLRVEEGDNILVGTHEFVVTPHDKQEDPNHTLSFEKASGIYDRMVADHEKGHLPLMYKASLLLGTIFDQDELLQKILRLICEELPVKRAFILTVEKGSNTPKVRVSIPKVRESEQPKISTTLIRQVFSERGAVLTLNAQEDFAAAESVLANDIQAVMCVPLCGREKVVGAIYVDGGDSGVVFTTAHLEILTALGRVTGVAVENARLYKETVENERLAAIGEATASMGHCIKNILAGIKGGAEFVDVAIGKEDWKYVQKGWPLVRRSTSRMEDLVLNLLTYSRERDKQPTAESTDLNKLIQELVDATQASADRAKVTLKFDTGDLPHMHVDSMAMYRALLNLVQNAIEACEEDGGTVTIVTSSDSNGVSIKVRDTGAGIDDAIRPQLFKAFATTKGSRGTGLGLACVHKIIEEHGGNIKVTSKKDKGTTFTVFLPSVTLSP
jgi:signal transduction histidine kinase/pSer/pThr/pTyr-binding forkhead associated (FHA) protein